MNERIKELALQAFESTTDPSFVYEADMFVNIFANSIVQECLDACSRANDIKHFVPPTQEQVVLSCMREIETTFRS